MTSESSNRPLVRVLCLPDVDSAIGGVKQLYRHVEHLLALGWDAAVLTEAEGFRPSWFASSAMTLSLQRSHELGELEQQRSILLLPETYLRVDLSAVRGLNLSSLARVVFNQNAYYSYGDFGPDTSQALQCFYDDPAVLQVLSISEDTHTFMARNLGLLDERLSRIINSIETIFSSEQPKSNRMHWMPRKNPQHVQAVIQGMQRAGLQNSMGWTGEPLQQLSHAQVAERLNGARLFLAFGHPEGFGLPIAEAMAAGCWVVGYSGGGGRELLRFGAAEEVPFGDWPGFVAAIQRSLDNFARAPRETALRLQRQALAVRALYSAEQERASIAAAWERIAERFQHWLASHPSQL
ncbi:glycosyltransferase [Prochlorococcus sp. MIT 1306]|uniref:glycosyltransferase n=1 Tax=Prochlorococcus sp. MIT 1306 TaxID=1799667 RepID=UPI0018D4A018|nr:glycosyltransferase [Prochlorococcus sp. MIT 1306]